MQVDSLAPDRHLTVEIILKPGVFRQDGRPHLCGTIARVVRHTGGLWEGTCHKLVAGAMFLSRAENDPLMNSYPLSHTFRG